LKKNLNKVIRRLLGRYLPIRVKQVLYGVGLANAMELMLRRLEGQGFTPTVLLDVGAYEGEWTRLAKSFWPKAPTYMFEAQSAKMPALDKVAASLQGVRYENVLLGAEDGKEATFFEMETGSSVYSEMTSAKRRAKKVEFRQLDTVLGGRLGEKKGAMLKIDVQGAEIDVLEGAKRTIDLCEFLLLECSLLEYNKGAPLFPEVITYLNERGFVLYDIATLMRLPTGHLCQVDALFCRKDSKYRPSGQLW
jgi:FkbM family methyltransferase